MKTFDYTVKDPVGIHARPAGLLIKEAKSYGDKITITKAGKSADATRLMAVMGLGIKQGETITVVVEGETEETTCENIKKFFEENL